MNSAGSKILGISGAPMGLGLGSLLKLLRR
jgi:hypothetical protein